MADTQVSDGDNSMEVEQKTQEYYKKKSCSCSALKKLCIDKGLKRSGNKTKLIERLLNPTKKEHKSNRKKS